MGYEQIIEAKKVKVQKRGFIANLTDYPYLFKFQSQSVIEALENGRYALFEGCGLGKTYQQLVWADQVVKYTNMPVILLAPLAVVAQTLQKAKEIGIDLHEFEQGITLTATSYIINYDQLHNIPCSEFAGVVLDESSILKNFTGKTKKELILAFKDTRFKLCCTATPAPNDLNEIGNQSEFLGVLDAQDMRAKWFVRDEGMNNYRLKGHAKKDFYSWMRTWCKMFNHPRDLGTEYDMPGYDLPKVNYHNVEIKVAVRENSTKLFNEGHVNATSFHREVKSTMKHRLEEVANIVNGSTESFIIWIEQNAEGELLRSLIPGAIEVKGSDAANVKKENLIGFAENKFRVLITKGEIAGMGMNYQNSHNMIFANPSFSFELIYQCMCRQVRFGQDKEVNIYMVQTDTMENVTANYKLKEANFYDMLWQMNRDMNCQAYGLIEDYEFKEIKTPDYHIMKGDSGFELRRVASNSVDFGIWSPPFSSLFTYSNYIHDLGNNLSHADFFEQYKYILKELYRALKPGRLVACHTKDLGVYQNSSGYTGIYDFTREHTAAMEAAGFKLHSKICIWTDPVLEMQRTKTSRLLYKNVTTDSTISGVGMAEYMTIFKKWEGEKTDWNPVTNLNRTNFDLDTWQEWASPVYRESLFNYEKSDLVAALLTMKAENWKLKNGANDGLPQSWYDDVWFDIKRTDVLNGKEGTAQGDEKHIAPLQLEVIRRCVNMWTNKGETVITPFLGIGSEAYVSIMEGRKAIGCELKDSYFEVAAKNIRKAYEKLSAPTLF